MDKHPQITNSLALIVREFYKNNKVSRPTVINTFKTVKK